MNDRVRVTWDDLKFGEELPWNVYDQNNKLLLSAGHTISNQETMENLRQYVLYRNVIDREHGRQNKQKTINVFAEVDHYIDRLAHIFADIDAASPSCKEKIERLARDLLSMCRHEPDATLALLRAPNKFTYSSFYALQRAIMCGMMAVQENIYPDEEIEIVAAALTVNVGMHQIQDEIRGQMRFPSDEQQYILDQYPSKSHAMLVDAGVENSHWLGIVRDHKACSEGRVTLDEASPGTIMLAVANLYSETLDSSAYNLPWSADEALDKYFADTPFENGHYARLILEIMTVYPPGIFVKLTNNEIAIVIQRGKQNPKLPILKSIEGENGHRYASPLLRDCSVNDYTINDFTDYDHKDMLNYSKLWGYVK